MPDILTVEEVQVQGQAMVNYLHKQLGELIAANANLTGQIALLEHRNAKLTSDLDLTKAGLASANDKVNSLLNPMPPPELLPNAAD